MDMAGLDRSLEQSLRALTVRVWRHKIVFVLAAGTGFAAIMVAALAIQPMYEGSTLLIGGQVGLEQTATGPRSPTESAASLARIAESEEVVGEAIGQVGLQTLVAGSAPNRVSLFARLRRFVYPSVSDPQVELSEAEAALPRIKAALSIRGEQTSDIIRIAFRHRDPVVAAQFANAVAQTFVDRQIALRSRPGAAAFFQRQRQRFEDEVKRTSEALETFAVQTGTYAADDQRELLLRRLSDLQSALVRTRGAISEDTGRRQALADQLRRLAPVARSPFVSGLVDALGPERQPAGNGPRGPETRPLDDRAADPPLLLVRVYQDSMVALFKANADLAASQALQRQLLEEAARLTAELNVLADNAQRFSQLKRSLDKANLNADLYTRRMIEEQIEAESNTARFAALKVLQKATVPVRPVFPNYVLVTGLAAVLGTLLGVAAACVRGIGRGSSARSLPDAPAGLRSSSV